MTERIQAASESSLAGQKSEIAFPVNYSKFARINSKLVHNRMTSSQCYAIRLNY